MHVVTSRYGATGPWAGWRGSDLCDWAASGYLYITGDPAREPVQGAGPWSAYVAGVTAATGAIAALHQRTRSGRGQLVDLGTMEAMAAAHQWSFVLYSYQRIVKRRANNRHAESHHPVALLPCADGWVCIAAPSPAQWRNLCEAMELAELADDPRYRTGGLRYDRADEIDALLEPWLLARSRSDVVQRLQDHHVPASPVLELSETLEDEQLRQRDFWIAAEHLGAGARMPGLPFRLPSSPTEPRPAPTLGQHTGEVLAELGCSNSELERLAGDGVIGGVAQAPATAREPRVRSRRSAPPVGGSGTPKLLAGIRVIEFGYAWAGPLAARTLADLGADVIKVEQDTARAGRIVPTADVQERIDQWRPGELPEPTYRAGRLPRGQSWARAVEPRRLVHQDEPQQAQPLRRPQVASRQANLAQACGVG